MLTQPKIRDETDGKKKDDDKDDDDDDDDDDKDEKDDKKESKLILSLRYSFKVKDRNHNEFFSGEVCSINALLTNLFSEKKGKDDEGKEGGRRRIGFGDDDDDVRFEKVQNSLLSADQNNQQKQTSLLSADQNNQQKQKQTRLLTSDQNNQGGHP